MKLILDSTTQFISTLAGIACDTSQELLSILLRYTVPCMCAAALSLFRTASGRLDSLAYIESITDAYSQYLVIDIQHTENNKHSQMCKLSLEQIVVSFYMVFP